jgi:hydrogenase large subunit
MAVKTIFPVTRIHEPMRIDVEVQGNRVVDAWIGAMLFRGFETMIAGRDPRDVSLFTQRICGICSSAHAVAAAMAQQQAFNQQPTPNGQHLTNLIFASDIMQNHLRHFYALVLYDYVSGPAMPPFVPKPKDYRLPKKVNDELLAHGREGLIKAAQAHELMAIFGAKAPHQQTIMPTGVTERAEVPQLMAYRALLGKIRAWVDKYMVADILTIADYYQEYYKIGAGYGNFLSYGMFPQPTTGQREIPAGLVISKGSVQPLAEAKITEEVRYSWYKDDAAGRHPSDGLTVPDRSKADAYTWVKAPRYEQLPVEGGPLARAWIAGERRTVSVLDRIIARARETEKMCRLAESWLDQIVPGAPSFRPYTAPPQGEGTGLTDAMRGALGHWLKVDDAKVSHYQIVTPTTWNFSPRDARGQRGPVEEALIGTPVADPNDLVEVGRVIRSFDPCFTCAVHVVDAPSVKPLLI